MAFICHGKCSEQGTYIRWKERGRLESRNSLPSKHVIVSRFDIYGINVVHSDGQESRDYLFCQCFRYMAGYKRKKQKLGTLRAFQDFKQECTERQTLLRLAALP